MTSGTDEEQLAQIKDWWQRNGKPLLTGGALAVALVFGWQFWQNHQLNQAYNASGLYQQLLTAALESGKADAAEVARLGNQLKQDFAGTHYAQYGSLFVAKVAVEGGRLDEAAAELRAIVDKPADATLGELARQRLARVLAAQDKAEDALKLLEGEAIRPSPPAVRSCAVICWCSWAAWTRRTLPIPRPSRRCRRMPQSAVCS